MSTHGLYTVSEVTTLIEAGRVLLLGGDEALLVQLPAGQWIAGTSANFMAPEGGTTSRDRIFASDITEHAAAVDLRSYSAEELPGIGADYPENGFTVLVVPGLSEIHSVYARDVQSYAGVFNAPLFGWMSGVHVSEIGLRSPKTFAGSNIAQNNRAVALHVTLPPGEAASIDIINLFSQGGGDDIEFTSEGFEVSGECLIGGKPGNLAAHITANALDTKLPLVADYNGAMINVSIRAVDAQTGKVDLYAPVFKGIKYRFANPVPDYISEFDARLHSLDADSIYVSCNCILNFLYAELEGKKTGTIVGPVTFGEIAYILLNQTLVYLSISKPD